MSSPICIAIDGPASSGKGTVARLVARALGYAYVDTGAMYRAVALCALERGIGLDQADAVAAVAAGLDFRFGWDGERLTVTVDGRDVSDLIRQEHVGRGASDVAVHPAVRAALLERQRALGRAGGVVMDGRDIGTVVLPDAALKIFLDASPDERARRRTLEIVARGGPGSEDPGLYQRTLDEIRARDLQDSTRAVAPLRRAADARVLDSTRCTAADMAARIEAMARQLVDAQAAPS